ncbi:MAG: hypothetical protein AAFU85_11500 [Planctomycetota bacterium]
MNLQDHLFGWFTLDSEETASARRQLRYLRLERRLLLSADMGELCAVNADDFDPFEEIDLWANSDGDENAGRVAESAGPSEGEPKVSVNETDVVLWREVEDFREIPVVNESPEIGGSREAGGFDGSSDKVRTLAEQIPLAPSNPLAGQGLADPSDVSLSPPVSNRVTSLVSTPSSESPTSPATQVLQPVAAGFDSLDVDRIQATTDSIELGDAENPVLEESPPAHVSLIPESRTNQLAEAPVAERAEATERQPGIATHMPDSEVPSESDQLNASSVEWLGPFADDLSLMDEAIAHLADEQPIEEAAARVMQKSPHVPAAVVASGLAASVMHQRTRKQQSQLEDAHCCVKLERRVYPNE